MYIDPFIAGVLATILTEVIVAVVLVAISCRKRK